ncbi:MAG: hypothetical protein L0H79_21795 [Intrasporangium sp.]|uniref:hypothetical protein n=1 Tax=Intrasporangium sp. TaxID=1925024 RepID=UPI00264A3DD9|nr:hypothetical protein [Intrasporangium sp.]MDN5798361.1 hypothetical protein [Intrasporangium sp.]
MVDAEPERYVTPTAARPYWAKHAYEILVETAGRYNAVITYSEFGEQIQRRSGLWTKATAGSWIGTLLVDLAKVSHVRGEPALSSLVVHKQDGQVGTGYNEVLRVAGTRPIDDPVAREMHAATTRLECYRHWGADVPADATPSFSPRFRESRSRRVREPRSRRESTPHRRAPSRASTERHGPVCPTCFLEMPLSGPCPNCTD